MRLPMAVMMTCAALFFLGCGAPEADDSPAPFSEDDGTVTQFGTCTALCNGGASVSCSGTTCSSTDGQGVTCDGVFKACACSGLPLCSQYAGKSCSPLYSRLPCCNNNTPDELVCSTNGVSGALTWLFW